MIVKIGEREYDGDFNCYWNGRVEDRNGKVVSKDDIVIALNELASLRQERDDLKKRVEELVETLEDMASQFAYRSVIKGKRFVTTGGLSALESCFATLGWDDPHSADDLLQGCEYPGCNEFASCGTPTPDGYKNCCGSHYREYNKPKVGDNEI